MRLQKNIPPLRVLLSDWREVGELYYFKKFLSEARKPFGSKTNCQLIKKNGHQNYTWCCDCIYRAFSKLTGLIYFLLLLVKCFFCSKNRVLIFNHTVRKRIGNKNIRPLYLPANNFDFNNTIVVDDQPNKLSYPQNTTKLNVIGLIRTASMVGFVLNLFYALYYKKSDRDIVDFLVKSNFWKIVLVILRPRRVAVVVWYGKEPLISACKQLGIEVFDLQHGIIYEEHPIYNILDGQKVKGSDFLLPNKCLVYGEYWREHLLKSGWNLNEVNVFGYYLDVLPVDCYVDDTPYILYTSQPHSNEAIIRHIRSIEQEVKLRRWRIVIALHPSEDFHLYSEILSEQVMLSKQDTYDLLCACEVHISLSSTLLWEAMLFNKSSYILEYGTEALGLLGDLIGFGYAKTLNLGFFPEPFELPIRPGKEFFFSPIIDQSLLYDF